MNCLTILLLVWYAQLSCSQLVAEQASCSLCDLTAAVQEGNNKLTEVVSQLTNALKVKDQMATLQKQIAILQEQFGPKNKGKDCADLHKNGEKLSGVYTINPSDQQGPIEVYCDMTTDGGGWTVFQKRQDGSVDFYRGWNEYKEGFGNLNGEFWIGNDKVNRLTNQDNYALRVDMEDTSGTQVYAAYDMFAISAESTKYQLSLGTYSGNAGDSLSGHKGYSFSTKDQDNDIYASGSCALMYKGAWWYSKCHSSNLNGLYHHGQHDSYANGINWATFKGQHYSLKHTEMKIRPVGFQSQK